MSSTSRIPLIISAASAAVAVVTGCRATARPSAAPAAVHLGVAGPVMPAVINIVPETPWWQTPPAPPPPPPGPVHLTWTLGADVLFGSGSADLSKLASGQLSGIINQAVAHPHATIDIQGFTDEVPDPQPGGNTRLSKERALAVAAYFQQNGLVNDTITTEGLGAANPIAPNDTEAGRQANRRVQITLTAP